MLWDGWFTRFKRRKHEPSFLATLAEVNHFKQLVKKQNCVACNQTTLQLLTFDRNPHGWEAQVNCTNCDFFARVNGEGFTLTDLHSTRKARP